MPSAATLPQASCSPRCLAPAPVLPRSLITRPARPSRRRDRALRVAASGAAAAAAIGDLADAGALLGLGPAIGAGVLLAG